MFVCFKKEDRQQAVMLQAACKKRKKTFNIVITVAIIAIYISKQGVSDLGYSLEYNAEVLKKVEILVALFLSISLSP